jgi:8-oxo-dGTP pyrophosphatase MutT (NUDIX family)
LCLTTSTAQCPKVFLFSYYFYSIYSSFPIRKLSFYYTPAFKGSSTNSNDSSSRYSITSYSFVPLLIFHTVHSSLYFIEPRRAAVALIIRVVPSPTVPVPSSPATPPSLTEFFELDWVNDPNARPEILFLRRDNPATTDDISPPRNTQEAHVAFPGGRMEPEDEGGLYTGKLYQFLNHMSRLMLFPAMRQTWEEIGIDLAERQYTCIGQLDDREITTSLGKRLLMVLSPFVFLQLTPEAPLADPVQSTTLHWTPLASLVSPFTPPKWSSVTVDAASRIAPKHSIALRLLVRLLIGSMQFPAILLDTSPSSPLADSKSAKKHDILEKGIPPPPQPKQNLKLWGLSLGMMLDLMSYMVFPSPPSKSSNGKVDSSAMLSSPLSPVMQLPYQTDVEGLRVDVIAPSLGSVFPRFSYPDVNFWIWYVEKYFTSAEI